MNTAQTDVIADLNETEIPFVSIVVPVYNGTAGLANLCTRVAEAMRKVSWSYEVILVDDHGPTHAWPVIVDLARRDSQVRGLRLSKNFGQHAATLCGISRARGQWIVTMDDDLEHPPEAIESMINAGGIDHPLVYGYFPRRTHSFYRNFSSELMRRTLKLAFPDINENYSSFRVIHSSIASKLNLFDLNKPYIDGMLSWITSHARSVEVSHGERRHGESAYTFRKLMAHAINIFVTFSPLPLRMATFGGIALASMSFLAIVYFIYSKLAGSVIPGYTSLISVILFACGIQLIILGVLGEYVGRLMGAAYKRPGYIVVDTAGHAALKATESMPDGTES